MKATLAKKELQETFLEFDLLGVVKRWLQVRHETGNCWGQPRVSACFLPLRELDVCVAAK